MKHFSLYIILLGLISPSCNKYLDKKSDSSLVVPSTLEDLQSILDDAEYINYGRTSIFSDASADEYFTVEQVFNALSDNDRKAYTWQPFDYFISNDWSAAYLPIYSANLCLEKVEQIGRNPINNEKWNNIKGSSLFIRAYYFLNLAWTYSKAFDENSNQSDLGIVLRLSSDFNIKSTRSNVKETYERVIKDAKESIEYLPENALHALRPSKASAYGLLARTYLSMRKYDSALKYSSLCLSLKNTLLDYKTDINSATNVPFQPFNKEIIFYSDHTGEFLSINAITLATIDTTLFSSYSASDIRRTAFFRSTSFSPGNKRLKGTYTGQFKYFSGIATDEMYLIRAECNVRLENKDIGLADLNTLLKARYDLSFTPVTATDATEALKIILLERRKELLLRGLRWIDIKRLNKEGGNIILTRKILGNTYTLLPNDNKYALPLPKDIITQTGVPQN